MQIGRAEKNELFIYAPTNLDGLTAITHCLGREILFEHRDELQRAYFDVKVGLDSSLIPKICH